jgi:hypothetical protein
MNNALIRVSPSEVYINKLRVFNTIHGRAPTKKEFIDGKLGNKSGIDRLFGNFTVFLKYLDAKEPKDSEFPDIYEDMTTLSLIMRGFNCDPIRNIKNVPKAINKAIFCNVLACKYPDLRRVGVMSNRNKRSVKTPVSKYLEYGSNNAVKSTLREGIIGEFKTMNKYSDYKMIKAIFEGDERHFQIESIRNNIKNSEDEIDRLTKEILDM